MKKGVFIIIAITVVAVVFYGVRYVRTPVDVMVAKAETKEVIISADGMIAYDEVVCNSPVSGTFWRRGRSRRISLCRSCIRANLCRRPRDTSCRGCERYTRL